MTPDEALAEAKRGTLRPVYLLLGEEQYFKDRVLSRLREAAVAGGVPGLNEDLWTAGEVAVDAVLAAARTLPMLAKNRLVVVRSLERWEPRGDKKDVEAKDEKRSSDALDRLAEYARAPSPSTILLLVASKLDSRRRLVTLAKKERFVVGCDGLARGELPRFVESAIAERGNQLEPGVADLIAELAGPELAPVADAVERVCLYVGSGGLVTEDAVAECVVRLRPTTVWELVGAVGRRDVGAALAALEGVYDPQDRGLRLLGVLAWSTRQLLRYEAAIRSGLAPPEAAQRAGAPPFKARELGDQLRRISRSELEGWLDVLAGVDVALKGGSKRPPKAVLEHTIIALCAGPKARDKGPSGRSSRPPA